MRQYIVYKKNKREKLCFKRLAGDIYIYYSKVKVDK